MATTQEVFIVGGQVRVNCQAKKSVLPHEFGVFIKGVGRSYESLMDSDLVAVPGDFEEESKGTVNAEVVQINGTSLLVELPRQVVAGGRRIWIPKSEVK